MKVSIRRWSGVLAIVVAVLLGAAFVLTAFRDVGSELAHGVTREALLELRPGATEQSIERLLGPPLAKEQDQTYAPEEKRFVLSSGWTWTYARPNSWGAGFSIRVTTRDGQVQSVDVKRDDLGVYSCSKHACPQFWQGNGAALDALPRRR